MNILLNFVKILDLLVIFISGLVLTFNIENWEQKLSESSKQEGKVAGYFLGVAIVLTFGIFFVF